MLSEEISIAHIKGGHCCVKGGHSNSRDLGTDWEMRVGERQTKCKSDYEACGYKEIISIVMLLPPQS